jgi:hypothetical protein
MQRARLAAWAFTPAACTARYWRIDSACRDRKKFHPSRLEDDLAAFPKLFFGFFHRHAELLKLDPLRRTNSKRPLHKLAAAKDEDAAFHG